MSKIPRIPYFETSRYKVHTMVELSSVQGFDKVADLGSGDGRISIAFAKKRALVTGFEIDEGLVEKSSELILEKGLQKHVKILNQDFWEADLKEFDIVCVYPMPDIMEELERKLKSDLKTGAKVLTNYYQFPNWKYTEEKNKVYLYSK